MGFTYHDEILVSVVQENSLEVSNLCDINLVEKLGWHSDVHDLDQFSLGTIEGGLDGVDPECLVLKVNIPLMDDELPRLVNLRSEPVVPSLLDPLVPPNTSINISVVLDTV